MGAVARQKPIAEVIPAFFRVTLPRPRCNRHRPRGTSIPAGPPFRAFRKRGMIAARGLVNDPAKLREHIRKNLDTEAQKIFDHMNKP